MRTNGYFTASGQKSDPAIRSIDLDSYNSGIFPLSDDVCSIFFMFLCTIFIWPCDFWLSHIGGVSCMKHNTSNVYVTMFSIYCYPFLSYG